jgi:hypothetical protein
MNTTVTVILIIYLIIISIVIVVTAGYTITTYYKIDDLSTNGHTGRARPTEATLEQNVLENRISQPDTKPIASRPETKNIHGIPKSFWKKPNES